jgi:hypothetical protein
LNLWKKAYWKGMEPAQLSSRQMSAEQMVAEIKRASRKRSSIPDGFVLVDHPEVLRSWAMTAFLVIMNS